MIFEEEEGNATPLCKLIEGFLTLISMFPNAIPLPDMTDLLDRGPFELRPFSCDRCILPFMSFNALDELKGWFNGGLNKGDSISLEIEVLFSLGEDEDSGFDEFMAKFPTDIEFEIRSFVSKRLS